MTESAEPVVQNAEPAPAPVPVPSKPRSSRAKPEERLVAETAAAAPDDHAPPPINLDASEW